MPYREIAELQNRKVDHGCAGFLCELCDGPEVFKNNPRRAMVVNNAFGEIVAYLNRNTNEEASMNNRPEILMAAMEATGGDIEVDALISGAMACETHFGMVAEVIENLRRFPQNAKVKERNGVLFVEYEGHEWDFDIPCRDVPDWANTEF